MVSEHWPLIEADLQGEGVDVGDEALMRSRSWRWLRVRILGLLDKPALIEPWTGRLMYQTRIQEAALPQPSDAKSAEK